METCTHKPLDTELNGFSTLHRFLSLHLSIPSNFIKEGLAACQSLQAFRDDQGSFSLKTCWRGKMASHPVRDSILIIPKAESPNGVCAGIVTLPCKQFMGFYDVHMNFLESLGVSAKADLLGFIATFSISNVANANDKWVSSCWMMFCHFA